jgi:predicted metal-dependent hydrolase
MPDPLAYTLIRSPRRRRTLSLAVRRDGAVVVRAPMRTPLRDIRAFVESRTARIERQRSLRACERSE